jgi:hypothetical protein
MATSTFLSNATVNITQGVTTTDLSDQCRGVTITVGYDPLESTAMGDTGHRFVQGLQSVEVTLEMFLSYGATEVEAILASCVGTGTTTLTISPSGTSESASNPEIVISNAMLQSYTPISSTVGELSMVTAVWTGGTWVRDVTP